MYRVVLNVDGEEFTQSVRVDNDPAVPNAVVTPPDAPRKLPGEKDEEHDKDDGGGDGV